ncbi:MAG: spermidine synthase [Thermodesulfobacteriota bacterium]
MLVLFTLAIFISAMLLFVVEPMFGKMVLPLLGGSPAVWNTCLVFFQGALLAGYLYAHLAPKWLGVRRQAAFHVGLLLLVLFTLPIGIFRGWTPPATANPVTWLLLLLMLSVGLPFFVVSTTAPLLQKWFAHTDHASAQDPYFLYGASNLGSLLALVAYPVLIEPYLRLGHQSWAWAGGYVLLVALIFLCGLTLWRASAPAISPDQDVTGSPAHAGDAPPAASRLTLSQRAWWVLLAFAPSSLLLGVTTYLATDIASVPLLWIVPLLIYLLTFVLVFARKPLFPRHLMVFLEPFFIVPVAAIFFIRFQAMAWPTIPLHLLAFFCIAMVCHGELMHSRPGADHLTEFYLWISAGGVLGGIFNALLAPVLFNSVIEYPLIIVVACLLRPNFGPTQEKSRPFLYDLLLPLALGLFLALLSRAFQTVPDHFKALAVIIIACLGAVVCYSFRFRPLRLALGVGVLIIAGAWFTGQSDRILLRERNFFGISKVTEDRAGRYHTLSHGSTIHGAQNLDLAQRREPLTYYHRSGPLGQIFSAFSQAPVNKKVAIIGLGTGTIACYAQTGQQFTFYEIDPTVVRIAREPRYFSYLKDCPAQVQIILGDARLSLRGAPEANYDMILVDAFNSDAIPIHLVTREALGLYLSKLRKGGILVFHISNRYLNLEPVLGSLAREAGLVALVRNDLKIDMEELNQRKRPSTWVVLARSPENFGTLVQDQRWQPLPVRPGEALWTDDFSNILSVFKWKSFKLDDWANSVAIAK